MYSLVLMMAMAAPAESPSFGWKSGCGGCAGYSTGCAGNGAGCGGGQGFLGLRSGGCCGGTPNWSCHGCGGCAGYGFSGYGPIAYYGFAGCYGSCYGSYTNYFSYWSTPPNTHYGYGMPMRVPDVAPKMPPADAPKLLPGKDDKKNGGKTMAPAAATVVVSLPASATLYANGHKTAQASAERRFVTPALEAGKVFHYVFTAETLRDGKPVAETRQVEVVAGGTTRVEFGDLAAAQPKADPTRVVIGGRIGD